MMESKSTQLAAAVIRDAERCSAAAAEWSRGSTMMGEAATTSASASKHGSSFSCSGNLSLSDSPAAGSLVPSEFSPASSASVQDASRRREATFCFEKDKEPGEGDGEATQGGREGALRVLVEVRLGPGVSGWLERDATAVVFLRSGANGATTMPVGEVGTFVSEKTGGLAAQEIFLTPRLGCDGVHFLLDKSVPAFLTYPESVIPAAALKLPKDGTDWANLVAATRLRACKATRMKSAAFVTKNGRVARNFVYPGEDIIESLLLLAGSERLWIPCAIRRLLRPSGQVCHDCANSGTTKVVAEVSISSRVHKTILRELKRRFGRVTEAEDQLYFEAVVTCSADGSVLLPSRGSETTFIRLENTLYPRLGSLHWLALLAEGKPGMSCIAIKSSVLEQMKHHSKLAIAAFLRVVSQATSNTNKSSYSDCSTLVFSASSESAVADGARWLVAQLHNRKVGTVPNERRQKRLKLLEERRFNYENCDIVEFTTYEALLGHIIGRQGDKLSRVAHEYKVEIRVLPDCQGVRKIRIYGADARMVRKAREELEVTLQEFPLNDVLIDYLLAKKASNARILAHYAQIQCCWLDPTGPTLICCGSRRSLSSLGGGLRMAEVYFRTSELLGQSTGISAKDHVLAQNPGAGGLGRDEVAVDRETLSAKLASYGLERCSDSGLYVVARMSHSASLVTGNGMTVPPQSTLLPQPQSSMTASLVSMGLLGMTGGPPMRYPLPHCRVGAPPVQYPVDESLLCNAETPFFLHNNPLSKYLGPFPSQALSGSAFVEQQSFRGGEDFGFHQQSHTNIAATSASPLGGGREAAAAEWGFSESPQHQQQQQRSNLIGAQRAHQETSEAFGQQPTETEMLGFFGGDAENIAVVNPKAWQGPQSESRRVQGNRRKVVPAHSRGTNSAKGNAGTQHYYYGKGTNRQRKGHDPRKEGVGGVPSIRDAQGDSALASREDLGRSSRVNVSGDDRGAKRSFRYCPKTRENAKHFVPKDNWYPATAV